jgi:membrane protein DedA with SNARE-associated domain
LIEFITTYGYLALLVGALLEGETLLLLAGMAAHQGHLSFPFVLLVAFCGGTVGDQVFFWIGRTWGSELLVRLPSFHARALRVGAMMQRWDAALVVAIRFLYGLRIAGPIAMGALGFAPRRFAVFNAIGAALWAVVVGGAGYMLGHSLQTLLGDLERYETAALWGVVLAAMAIVALKLLMRVRRAARLEKMQRHGEST